MIRSMKATSYIETLDYLNQSTQGSYKSDLDISLKSEQVTNNNIYDRL